MNKVDRTFLADMLAFVAVVMTALVFALCVARGDDTVPVPVPAPGPKPIMGDALKLPAEPVHAKRDHIVGVKPAATTAKRITWEIPPAVDFQPKPSGFVPGPDAVKVEVSADTMLYFTAPPGTYTIRAYAAIAESVAFAEMKLIVETDEPPTPKPPEPKPPDPKPPIPPAPSDPFAADLRRLYAADSNPNKRAPAEKLLALYRLAATLCNDKTITTCEELMDTVRDAARTLAGDTLLPIRQRVAGELGKLAGPSDTLSEGLRQKLADVFSRAAAALEDVAK